MKEIIALNPGVRQAVTTLLGPALEPTTHTLSILTAVDDHIFLWNSRFYLMLYLVVSSGKYNTFF